MHEWVAPIGAAIVSAVAARVVAAITMRKAPPSLVRVNVDGRRVPAVLGFAVVFGGAAAVAFFALWEAVLWPKDDCGEMGICSLILSVPWHLAWVALVPTIGLFIAGLWDDLRGDERPRGFSGHLGALRGGALTGGVVKLVAGAVVGVATVLALEGWRLPIWEQTTVFVLMAASIALCANLVNLFDRAPGRAIKVFLSLTLITLIVVPEWRFIVAGPLGAALGVMGLDLHARGMLGDSGANPLGAVAGLGLALIAVTRELPGGSAPSLWVLVVVLLGLNLLSEKVSFSKVIERTPWLARLDHLGRD